MIVKSTQIALYDLNPETMNLQIFLHAPERLSLQEVATNKLMTGLFPLFPGFNI